MKNRTTTLKELLRENFAQKEDNDEEEYEEDTLVKRSVDDILNETIEEFPNDNDFSNFNIFRRQSFPGDDFLSPEVYGGKSVSRKSLEEESDADEDSDQDLSDSSEIENDLKNTKRVTFAKSPEKTKRVKFSKSSEKTKRVKFAESSDEYASDDEEVDSESSEIEKNLKKTKRVTFVESPKKTKRVTFAESSSEDVSDNEEVDSESSEIEKNFKKAKRVTFAESPKKTKRVTFAKSPKKAKHVTFAESSNELVSDDEDVDSEDDKTIHNQSENGEDDESDDEELQESHDEEESADDESEIEDDVSEEEVNDPSFMYSKEIRDESNEQEKGKVIRNQLNLCELLLESRITLQKALFTTNQLPKPDNYQKIWAGCSEDGKSAIIQCREKVWDLLEKFLRLQCQFRKQCPEFMETLDESAVQEYEAVDEAEPKIKRRKLSEYPTILKELHNHYKPYRNTVIQKWNDRTKAAYGKLAKKDFSAFDLPITKQIDQIMADRQRIIHRTHIKRANYKIIGEEEPTNDEQPEISVPNKDLDYDEEIYDDDDFYHKLLRDYIERKTADVSDPTQLGRKWIQLQSLRSKMKRRIDTRRTKGRKIKFDVHPKLVNFMAPIEDNPYTETAMNELYNSVFGKNLINS